MEKDSNPTREIDYALDLLRETIVDEYTIVPKTWILEAIDKLLDRRFEITKNGDTAQ